LGDDDAGRRLQALLRTQDVRLLGRPSPDHPTILKTRVVLRTQQLCRLDHEAPAAAYRPAGPSLPRPLDRAVCEAEIILLSDYAKGYLGDELVSAVGARARPHGRLVALDPHPRNPLDLAAVDLLKPNRAEALALAGLDAGDPGPFPTASVCHQLHERHALRHLVITLGEEGMVVSTRGSRPHQIPTEARQVFDVTGAGDTSLAALGLGLVAGAALRDAAQLANAAAGVVVGKLGTATTSPAEILAHLTSRAAR
jgi:D-glycero-beta-D-manno-heptose-7-phosphate kinase